MQKRHREIHARKHADTELHVTFNSYYTITPLYKNVTQSTDLKRSHIL